ncbi:MAG: sugar transferase [Candidatus Ratteibacteria bacterium]|nr:sugar transferase [Candidatus Ratteibacteria bacterium]
MLKEHPAVFRKLMIFADLCIMIGSFFFGYFLRDKMNGIYPLNIYILFLPLLLLIWGSLLYHLGMYESFRIKKLSGILFIIFKTAIFGFLIFGSFTYIFKVTYISRTFISLIFIMAAVFIGLEKVLLMQFLRYLRKRGANYRNILIIGTGKRAQNFIGILNRHIEWGFKIIGLIDENEAGKREMISGCKVLGAFKDLPDIIHNNVVDEVLFVVPHSWLGKIEEIMHFCEAEGLKVSVAMDYFKLKFSRAKQVELNGFPLLTFETTPDKLWHLLLKRLFDIIFAGISLILLSPVFAAIALTVKATSRGSVFFKQERCGVNGRRFTLYKFRTMGANADTKLKDIFAYNEMNGPVFKMTNDPRLTKAGKFLRKFSIDELPQLWNVLKGDMSIVGPRPAIPTEIRKYDSWQRRRLSMAPGITCLWQVNGRNTIVDFNRWMKLDLEYIDNWSLWVDFKILLKTIPVVLFACGAK